MSEPTRREPPSVRTRPVNEPRPLNDTTVNETRPVNEHTTVNETRARLYELLMVAQEQIALARYARGVEHETVLSAIDAAQEQPTDTQRAEDLYLSSLAAYVEALGGELEIRAVFGEEVIVVKREHL